VRVGAGGEIGVEQREAELPRTLERPNESNQPSHLSGTSDLVSADFLLSCSMRLLNAHGDQRIVIPCSGG